MHIAITGGTGRYDNARGQITSTPTSDTTTRSIVDLDYSGTGCLRSRSVTGGPGAGALRLQPQRNILS